MEKEEERKVFLLIDINELVAVEQYVAQGRQGKVAGVVAAVEMLPLLVQMVLRLA